MYRPVYTTKHRRNFISRTIYQTKVTGIQRNQIMQQTVTISFLDPTLGTTYTICEPVARDIANNIVKNINATTFDEKSCLEMRASFITNDHVWIIGKFGNSKSLCNQTAQCRLEHLSPNNKLRACIGRMSRGQCNCSLARPAICTALWPDTYCKQK